MHDIDATVFAEWDKPTIEGLRGGEVEPDVGESVQVDDAR